MSADSEIMQVAAQGSFTVGGSIVLSEGAFDPRAFICRDGNTRHVDHAYVQYQIPPTPRRFPLVLLHGGGQHARTWESTPDGREGYQTLMLRRGWPVYIVDQPGRGRAGNGSVGITINPGGFDRSLWEIFRLGVWPDYFPGVQFDQSAETIDQYWRQTAPDTAALSEDVVTAAFVALFNKIGPAILVSHSHGGQVGFRTILESENIVANVSYEPAQFLFPDNEPPPDVTSLDPFVSEYTKPILVSRDQFQALTRLPIQLIYGDYIPTEPSPYGGLEFWRVVMTRARQFADVVNRHGGNVTILNLPDLGITGNTHFPFSDLNNVQIADLLSDYLNEKELDARR